eukprot:gnl/TRDRNA2_/TRDRNA2_171723_c0_seq4.p1 gnl/TRDRNA2_/TRDRNA2_171723_c0~~gnl/TRDRNA2_/TRDRNA2_171723_c0_seq4.p1  ORF type:complete len:201 (+),score=56.04 gnl/TRDRNA2_/TRDRNA2_171723_c0_seq4:108-710(+)
MMLAVSLALAASRVAVAMPMFAKKSKKSLSKRMTLKKKYKIRKKVSQHNRKVKKQQRNMPKRTKAKNKNPDKRKEERERLKKWLGPDTTEADIDRGLMGGWLMLEALPPSVADVKQIVTAQKTGQEAEQAFGDHVARASCSTCGPAMSSALRMPGNGVEYFLLVLSVWVLLMIVLARIKKRGLFQKHHRRSQESLLLTTA